MAWRYGLIKTKLEDGSDWYAVHELHMNPDNTVHSWTEHPITLSGESPEELLEVLRMITSDLKNSEPFEPPQGDN